MFINKSSLYVEERLLSKIADPLCCLFDFPFEPSLQCQHGRGANKAATLIQVYGKMGRDMHVGTLQPLAEYSSQMKGIFPFRNGWSKREEKYSSPARETIMREKKLYMLSINRIRRNLRENEGT